MNSRIYQFVISVFTLGLISILLSGCCKEIKNQLAQTTNEKRELEQTVSRIERILIEKNVVIDSLKTNQLNVEYPIGNKYLKCFVYVDNNESSLGILRPIVEVDHMISSLWDYLPGLLFDENTSDVFIDSIVYAKLKIVNGIPFGYDIQRERPSQTLVLNSADSVNLIVPHVDLNFHSTFEGVGHTPRTQHKHGHIWKSSIKPDPDIGLDVVLLTQSQIIEEDRRSSINDYDEREIDTFFVHRMFIPRIDFIGNRKFFVVHEPIDAGLSVHDFQIVTNIDTVHRHSQHPKPHHLKNN